MTKQKWQFSGAEYDALAMLDEMRERKLQSFHIKLGDYEVAGTFAPQAFLATTPEATATPSGTSDSPPADIDDDPMLYASVD